MTDEDKFEETVLHIDRDHPWIGEPVSKSVKDVLKEHEAIHEFENAKAKFNMVRHRIQFPVEHAFVGNPED